MSGQTARLATFIVCAQLETQQGQWTGSRQIPAFTLPVDIHGCMSDEGAEKIARDILDPLRMHGARLHISVCAIQDGNPTHPGSGQAGKPGGGTVYPCMHGIPSYPCGICDGVS